MGHNDRTIDDGFKDFLQEVIDGKHLDGAALGITKVVIDKGRDALSAKQSYVFEHEVLGEFSREKCSNCGIPIPWSEMYAAHDNGGMCSSCSHRWEKLKTE